MLQNLFHLLCETRVLVQTHVQVSGNRYLIEQSLLYQKIQMTRPISSGVTSYPMISPLIDLVGEEESQEGILKFSSLSISDVNGNSTFLAAAGGDGGHMFMPTNEHQHELSPSQINGRGSFKQMSPAKPWDINIIDGSSYGGDLGQGYLDDMLNQQRMEEGTDVNSLEFLASQFPGFAAESLAGVYYMRLEFNS